MPTTPSNTHAPTPTRRARRVIDLSHTIAVGGVTYPGLPTPIIDSYLSREESPAKYAPGSEFTLDMITMIGNTGTYIDSPFHCFAGGTDLAGLELESLVGLPAEVIHLPQAAGRGIDAEAFGGRNLEGAAVLLHTGWDRYFGMPEYATGAPFLTEQGARFLVDAGAALVGIDSLNIDDKDSGGSRPAHTLLLGAGIHIVEHLTNLGDLPAHGARFTAVPPKVADFGTFPVRAFAETE
ncbi:cyclase family protein [Arthrobacter sp. CAN_C5]|uniref:cyclase family protein n=1 Tax=Arthrobacter sp. CAN_C5 TaxID=2760706 RepID=UPI001AE9135C|nr:cyclase family protein [Arthrobacter sp. CAN_C5]MBP2216982.1 kynurenine formamidase [Arthrobacter sp. CAN_C5]